MTGQLTVLLAGDPIGVLSQDRQTTFRYAADYLERTNPTPLSLSMPLRAEPYGQAQTLPWLDGLLPDRQEVRQRWASQFGVSARNPFALMAHVGRDCPGAVQICPLEDVDTVRADRSELQPLAIRDIGRRLEALRLDTDSWTVPGESWSLAGAQAKFAITELDGSWYEALHGAPTTHIVKPGVTGYAAQGLNEHVCMSAARELGILTARTRYLDFDGQHAVVIDRYDRQIRDGRVRRIHQEDLCQALSYPPAKKYETDGGPGAAMISDLLHGRADESSNWRFVEAVAFNYLLGASDAHAKNYSVLLSGAQIRLAPLYDLASSLPYDPVDDDSELHRTAMAIGGQRRFGQVTRTNWQRLARRCGIEFDRLAQRVAELADRLPDVIATVVDTIPVSAERDALRGRLLDRIGPYAVQVTASIVSGDHRL